MPLDPIRLAKFLRKMGYVHALIRGHLHAHLKESVASLGHVFYQAFLRRS